MTVSPPDWILECSDCGLVSEPAGLPSVCSCGLPWLVRYPGRTPTRAARDQGSAGPGKGMWRWRGLLPLGDGEEPVTLGEGDTPELPMVRTGARIGLPRLTVKDESVNPTGSFKSRGLSAAVTRARAAGASTFVIPTAGNAGVAAAAYGARAGAQVRVYAPRTTPAPIRRQIVAFGADLVTLDGHIGDCGAEAKRFARESGAVDLSTLREPYRIEGKKTLGIELAHRRAWRLPDVILYPAGGGTGLIGMWKAFVELRDWKWISGPLPRMYAVQSAGCAPVVRAVEQGAPATEPWADPWTVASGLRVPSPLGGRLMLRVIRESGGGAVAVTDDQLTQAAERGARDDGVDFSPEGGACLVAAERLAEAGVLDPGDEVVIFNTGAGWLYRDGLPGDAGPDILQP